MVFPSCKNVKKLGLFRTSANATSARTFSNATNAAVPLGGYAPPDVANAVLFLIIYVIRTNATGMFNTMLLSTSNPPTHFS